ncbi:MAG TPA: choice-of-anchor D domain-containing protein [Jatrophihabitans sp.]|uniref:choice-of-anchor D domain-containing protein n=1 Tax=Jatrophihabitans sp. TaxID=1932789 RepID=UPI002DF79457|nr:choice-of-anchor D domain-containing protein [Jatrophihabitans sp.]
MSEHVFQRRRLTAAVTLTAVTVTWAVLVAPGSPGNAAAPVDGIQRVSVRSDGAQVNADSLQEAMSADGTQVAFVSSGNLAPGQFNAYGGNTYQSVFVRDTTTGKTVQLSVGETSQVTADGLVYTPNGYAPAGRSLHPSISADGRYVSFVTESGSGVVGTAQGYVGSVVVCDRDPDGNKVFDDVQPGTNYPNFRCVVVSALARTLDNMGASRPELDNAADRIAWSDGCSECITSTHYVDLPRSAGQLIPPNTGTVTVPNTYTDADNATVDSNDIDEASLSGDGSHIVAVAIGTTATPARRAIVKYDIPFGSVTNPLVEIDASNTTPGRFFNTATATVQVDHPRLSDDGRYVVFDSPSPTNTIDQAWLVDTTQVATQLRSTLVSVGTAAGQEVDGLFPTISGDGRYIAFLSDQTLAHDGKTVTSSSTSCLPPLQSAHVVAGSSETQCQVVVRDRVLDAARAAAGLAPLRGHLASPSTSNACPGKFCVSSGTSIGPLSLSETGYRVAYNSYANDIVAKDTNTSDSYATPAADVFVRTWLPTATVSPPVFGNVRVGSTVEKLVTLTVKGFGPIPISRTDLGTGSGSSFTDNGFTCFPTTAGLTTCTVSISFSPLFPGKQTGSVEIFTLDPSTKKFTAPITATGVRVPPTKSAPGDTTRTSVTGTGTGTQAADGGGSSMISGNGRWDVFTSVDNLTGRPTTSTNPYQQPTYVYVRDLADPQHTIQISLHAQPGTDPTQPTRPHAEKGAPTAPSPNGPSYTPSISDDGRFVSFITSATDIVPTPRFSSGVLVVCDRDPNGNGVFDEVQPGTQVPDYVCYGVDAATDSSGPSLSISANTPRLSGDGTRIAWTQFTGTQPFERVEYADLSVKGGPLQAPTNYQSVFVNAVPGFDGAATMDPVLSQDGRQLVLVAQAPGGGDLPPTAIVEVDLGNGTRTRLDRVPGTTSVFIGDTGRVANPAMSSNGSVVAFEGSPGFQTGSIYVARLAGSTVTTFVGSRNNSGIDDTGFSPALSGDGRYLAFVTGAPNMHNGVDVPTTEGCGGTDGPAPIACQVVARDLTRDAQRAAAGQSFLPGELVSVSVRADCGTQPAGVSCGGNAPSGNPSIDLIGSEIGFDSDANDLVPGDTNDTTTSATGDSFVHTWRPTLTAAPVAFGNVVVHATSTRSFGVSAGGFGPVTIAGLQLSGVNASDFAVTATTCTGGILHAKIASDPGTGNVCTATVTFTPAALGPRSGFLSVRAGPNVYPVVDPLAIRPLTGTGTTRSTVPQIGLNPTTLNFGSDIPLHLPGKKKTIVVSNPGGGTLTITGVTVTDTTVPGAKNDYTVDTSKCSGGVPAGGTCTITVTFIGHAVGLRPGIIVISDNASGGPVQVTVIANVPKPTITVNPAVTPTGRVVTVSGVGFAPNTTVSLAFTTSVEQADAKVDAKGAFAAPLVIFSNSDEGPRTIRATTLLADPSIAATTPLLVALGTLESPTLVIRH